MKKAAVTASHASPHAFFTSPHPDRCHSAPVHGRSDRAQLVHHIRFSSGGAICETMMPLDRTQNIMGGNICIAYHFSEKVKVSVHSGATSSIANVETDAASRIACSV